MESDQCFYIKNNILITILKEDDLPFEEHNTYYYSNFDLFNE